MAPAPFRLRLGLGLLWLASLGGAYWVGKNAGPAPTAKNASAVDSTPVTLVTRGGAADPAGVDPTEVEADEEGAPGKKPVSRQTPAEILSQIRQELGTGTQAMNLTSTFRAFSPLLEMPPSQVRGVLAEVAAQIDNPQQRLMFESFLLSRWAEEDPLSALAYVEERLDESNPQGTQGLLNVVASWARQDPDAAWQWYQKRQKEGSLLADAGSFDSSLWAIFGSSASRDLETTLARLSTLDNDRARNSAIGGMAMAGMDPEVRKALLERSETLDPETRRELRRSLVGIWSQSDPRGAMEWTRSLPAEEREALIDQSGYTFVAADPERGAALLLEGASENALPNRYRVIVDAWANRDPVSAGEWLNRQPKSPALDQARNSFARRVVRGDPPAAMAWAGSIENEEQRRQSITWVYQQWHRRDPAAANEALAQSGLPPERIQEIRK